MLAFPGLLIPHLPFTGSRLLRSLFADAIHEGFKLEVGPANFELLEHFHEDQRPRLLVVRNPYHWYVSWYCCQRRGSRADGRFDEYSSSGKLGFIDTLHNWFGSELVQSTGKGPFSLMLEHAAGPACEDWIHIPIERIAELADKFRQLESDGILLPGSVLSTRVEQKCQAGFATDHEAMPNWPAFHDESTRELIQKFDGQAMEKLGYGWQAGPVPGALIQPVQGVSLPRSGHSAVFDFLHHYFREELVLCDALDASHCGCGHVPCCCPETNLGKSHDFALLDETQGISPLTVSPAARYLVQYRNPVRMIVSNFRLAVLQDGLADDEGRWKDYCEEQLGYWQKFMHKWVLQPAGKNRLLVDFDRLLQDPRGTIIDILGFLSPARPDSRLVNTILERVPIESRDNLARFQYYDESYFDGIEQRVAPLMTAAGINTWRRAS